MNALKETAAFVIAAVMVVIGAAVALMITALPTIVAVVVGIWIAKAFGLIW